MWNSWIWYSSLQAKLKQQIQNRFKQDIRVPAHLSTLSLIVLSLQLSLQLYSVFLKFEIWQGRNPVYDISLFLRDYYSRGGTGSSFFLVKPLEILLHLMLNLGLGRSNLQSLSYSCSITWRLSYSLPSSLRFLSIQACSLSLRYIWQNSSLNQGQSLLICPCLAFISSFIRSGGWMAISMRLGSMFLQRKQYNMEFQHYSRLTNGEGYKQ